MIEFTPSELELLNKLKATGLNTPKPQPIQIDPLIQKQFEEAQKGNVDSTLGILGNRLSVNLADELPKNLATVAKVVTPNALGLNDTYNKYIQEQTDEAKFSENLLTDQAKESTTRTVGDVIGGAASFLAPAAIGGIVGGVPGAIGTVSALGAGSTGAEFAERRKAELQKDPRLTPEQIQAQIDNELGGVVAKDFFMNQLPANAISGGVGGALAKQTMRAIPAALAAAAVDAPIGGLSGYGSEQIIGENLASGPDAEMAKQKAMMGAIVGGGLSGTIGGLGAGKNFKETQAIRDNAIASRDAEKVVSAALAPETAAQRADFLNRTNNDGTIKYEVKDIEKDGVIVPNRKHVVAIKNIPEEVKVETPVKDTTTQTEEPKVKPVEEGVETPTVLSDSMNDISTPKVDGVEDDVGTSSKAPRQKDLTTEELIANKDNIRHVSPESVNLDTAQAVQRKVKLRAGVDANIITLKDRDNSGRPLKLEQTLKEEALYKAKGVNDQLNSFKADKLNLNELSDQNMKARYTEAEANKGTKNLALADNKNIKERNPYVYDPHSRTYSDGKGSIEFVSAVNVHADEPFLNSIKDLKDNSEITLVRENNTHTTNSKGEPAGHAIAVYADGVKVGFIADDIAKQFSRVLDSGAVDKLSVRPIAEEMEWSKKDLNDKTRQSYLELDPEQNINAIRARTRLVIKADLNEKAQGLTYSKKTAPKTYVEVPLLSGDKEGKSPLQVKREQALAEKEKVKAETIAKREEFKAQREEAKQAELAQKQAAKEEKLKTKEELEAKMAAAKEEQRAVKDEARLKKEEEIKQKEQAKAEKEAKRKEAFEKDEKARIERETLKQEKIAKEEFIKKQKAEEKAEAQSVRKIKDINEDKGLSSLEREAETTRALNVLDRKLTNMNQHNVNNRIKTLITYDGTTKKFSTEEWNLIRSAKQENPDGLGAFIKTKSGESIVVVNLDNVAKVALKSGLDVEDYAKFILVHESLGHGSLRNFFKTEADLNTYLDKVYDRSGDAVVHLMEKKFELYGNKKDIDDLTLRRDMIEEVISDLASGKVSYMEDGKMVVKTIEMFARDFAKQHNADIPKYKQVLRDFTNFIKGFINDITGNDIFKTYKDTKDDLNMIHQELKEMQKTLNSVSEEVKLKNDFMANSDIETIRFARALAQNADLILTEEYRTTNTQKVADFFGSMYSKIPWLGTMWGRRQRDVEFRKGFDYLTRIDETSKAVDSMIQKKLKEIYTSGRFGWTDGPSKESIVKINKALFDTEVSKKRFTDAELTALGLDDKAKIAYNSIIDGFKMAKEYKAMSKIYRRAFALGLKSEEMYDKYRNLNEMNYEQFKKDVKKDLRNSDTLEPNGLEILDSYIESMDETVVNVLNFEIVPTGTHFAFIRDKDRNIIRFEQFNSLYQANKFKQRMQAKYKNIEGLEFHAEKTPSTIKDVEDQGSRFARTAREYHDYVVDAKERGVADVVPFDYYKTLFATIDDTSKTVGVNIHVPKVNAYIKDLKETGNQKLADELKNILDHELTPDSALATKFRHFNSIWNLGGSMASAASNMTSIPLIVDPYLGRYEGGRKFLWSAANDMKLDPKIWSGKISKEELVDHIVSKYVKTDNIEQAKLDVKRLLEAGILKDMGDYSLVKVKDGVDLTSKYSNLKNMAVNGFMMPFAKSEQLNRMITGVASLNTAYKNNLQGFDFARETIYSTQGYYGKVGRPVWARSGVGQLLYQFKTYPMNFTEMMFRFAFGEAKDKKAALWMAGLLTVAGGLKSFPLGSDAGDVIDTARRVFGDEDANIGKEIDDTLRKMLGNEGSGLMLYGFASEFGLPFNMQQRISFNNLIPGTNLLDPANKDRANSVKEIGGATVTNATNMIDSLKQFAKGEYYQSAYNAAPSSIKAMLQGGKAAATGQFEDKNGNKVASATTGEAWLRFFSLQPSNLAETYRTIERMSLEKQNLTYIKGIIYDLYSDAKVKNDPNLRLIGAKLKAEYNKAHPDQKPIELSSGVITRKTREKKMSLADKSRKGTPKELRPTLKDIEE